MTRRIDRNGFQLCLIAILATALTACAGVPAGMEPLETVQELELDRFSGEWFVIANIPYFAERGNVRPRVIYRPRDDGRLDDLYYYRETFGEPEQSKEGIAWVPDPAQPGVLKTRFVWPFTFDYLVIKLDPDYRYVAVGHPSRDYAWIMARSPAIPAEVYADYLQAFAEQGFDASRIQRIAHRPEQLGQEGFQPD